jgi:hypothetical protein
MFVWVLEPATPSLYTVERRQPKEEAMIRIRRLVGRSVAAAGAIGAAAAIALFPQPGLANHLTFDEHSNGAAVSTSEPAPSAACVAAQNAFKAALKADVAEDATERDLAKTGTNPNDPTEDTAEKANFKTLRTAMVAACEPQEAQEHPTSTPACTAARASLKSFISAFRSEEKAEEAGGGEGTDADRSEDAGQIAQLKSLFQAAASACGFEQKTTTHDFNRSDAGWDSGWSNYSR